MPKLRINLKLPSGSVLRNKVEEFNSWLSFWTTVNALTDTYANKSFVSYRARLAFHTKDFTPRSFHNLHPDSWHDVYIEPMDDEKSVGDEKMIRNSQVKISTTRTESPAEEEGDYVRIYANSASDLLDLQHLESLGIGTVHEQQESVYLEITPPEE